nr:glucosamine 6-phosphate N-acetyltransferase isoform X2 [Tanacetum cinerariifolium]
MIVATGSVFIEKKFVRSCGKAGHIEDVVVDSSARGMQLGKKVIGNLKHFLDSRKHNKDVFRNACLLSNNQISTIMSRNIGDGGGDFCPTLKLGKEDHIMPRKDFPLHNLILKSSVPVKPEVHEWSDGDELNKILLRLINPL